MGGHYWKGRGQPVPDSRIRVLIVDDEPPAIQRIRNLLEGMSDIEVMGECGDGQAAVAAIRKLRPDLVFLDIQIPGLNGFQVIEQLSPAIVPAVVFVTAFDQHAIQAFEVQALDYLLKPFDRQRFEAALNRARQQVRLIRGHRTRQHEVPASSTPLAVKADGRITLVPLDAILWFEAVGKYVNVHTVTGTLLYRETIRTLEAQLDGVFVRIHRSSLVNVRSIVALEPAFHGDYVVRLASGQTLPLGRKYRDRVRQRLGLSS